MSLRFKCGTPIMLGPSSVQIYYPKHDYWIIPNTQQRLIRFKCIKLEPCVQVRIQIIYLPKWHTFVVATKSWMKTFGNWLNLIILWTNCHKGKMVVNHNKIYTSQRRSKFLCFFIGKTINGDLHQQCSVLCHNTLGGEQHRYPTQISKSWPLLFP